ncbi:TPA: sodium:solute symporter family protein [Clostridium botulinum]|uniref:sodium:solute symporter family protein n=1 Tax=Clostridium botulinum TaxID=1491 RepID=UPI000D0D6E5D|nr:sodium:solute symporter family protein [Clostridium botulinum]PSM03709.1 sodium:solute symporter [Clostridium botulinum]HDK7139461.1 sodium:solute symporter family protein [Clostridium botulinum]HDK7140300.1 sodium:solute symporter family protein [Clostridium botulinum]HDK7143681.1 sodium:solute symporter family protein [Clostridium botulinum]HDK7143972.1 sodium:solute symporter family protein [Clostridium botulinum]
MKGYLIFIIIYAIILILAGFFVKKYVKGAADFFVAGRKLNSKLLCTTLIAANIGAGSTVGITGIAYKYGVSSYWWIFMSAIGTAVLAFLVGPKIWEKSMKYNLYTLGDYLDIRYSKYFKGAISIMMTIGTLALFAGQLMGIAWILDVTSGIDKNIGILIGAVVVVLYFSSGGLLSSAIVNVLELVIIILGFIIAVPFCIKSVNGFSGLHTAILNNLPANEGVNYFSLKGIGISTIVGWFLMLTPSFFISPGLIGKVYGAKDMKTIKKGAGICAVVQGLFAFLPTILGMCAFAVFPNLNQQELALPMVMKNLMPFSVSALALAAIFAAEVSTADAVLYMLTTTFTEDIYKTFINPKIDDKNLLKTGRIVTIVGGILGVAMAFILPNIITALSIFYTLMSVSLTVPLLFGLFSEKPNTKIAFTSSIIGIIITLYLQFQNNDKGIWILNAQSTGILCSLIVMIIFLALKKETTT